MRRFLIIAIFLSLTLFGQGGAVSQRPPLASKSDKDNIERDELRAIAQKGTDSSPFVIKIIPTPIETGKTQSNDKETKDKEGREMTANIIAGLTALILLIQTVYFRSQANRLKESIGEMKKEFLASHRPRFIVRNVTMKPQSHPSLPVEPGKPLQIEWVVVNVGATPAAIIEGNATRLIGGKSFEARTPYSPERNHMKGISLTPGEAYTFVLTADEIDFQNVGKMSTIRDGEQIIYFFGFLVYIDNIGIKRRTAFCRKYDYRAERFTIVEDPDYEYKD